MSNDIVLFEKIDELEAKIKELENELKFTDEAHLHELKTMRDYMDSVMQKYLIK